MNTDTQEAAKWNAAGAKRTAEDIAASRKKAAQMLQRADMTCSVCGSLLSAVTFTCVRGQYCGKPFKHSSTNHCEHDSANHGQSQHEPTWGWSQESISSFLSHAAWAVREDTEAFELLDALAINIRWTNHDREEN